jgi:hypothetical protein
MVLQAQALRETVQEFQPPDSLGTQFFHGYSQRGPILPEFGSRERNRQLRLYGRHEHNTLWQGALSGFLKKIASTPWEISGPSEQVPYYQELLQNAHFGQGWKFLLMRFGRDYHEQDFGGVLEIIGPGDSTGPLTGKPSGIAVLDSLRCIATGNQTYPLLYFSHITSKLHRMHYTRVARFADMPDGDERFYGEGLCALSRYISMATQEMLINRYITERLDDKPPPGILTFSNISGPQVETAVAKYMRDINTDEMNVWGRTMPLYSIDPTAPLEVNSVAFSQPPEKFDYTEYTDLNINALALAMGVDKQELWQLTGGSLGSGAQSVTLSQKARGKGFGDFLTTIERFVNINILRDGMTFAFKYKDQDQDEAQARNDQAYIDIAEKIKAMGYPSSVYTALLADKSDTFRQVLTSAAGQMQASDVTDPARQVPEVTATDADAQQNAAPGAPQAAPVTAPVQKDYAATRAEFAANLTDLVVQGLGDDVSRRRFGAVMRTQLRRLGQVAYEDGLKAGGVEDAPDDSDLNRVQSWLADQSGYVTGFADEVYKQGLTRPQIEQRTEMWANKSLQLMFDAGRQSADKNGLYEWKLGTTEKHCETCKQLAGQIHRFKEWYKRDLLPKRDKLDCKGFNCDCRLERTTGRARGRFKAFSPSQPRDEGGQWTSGGSYQSIQRTADNEIHHMPANEASPLHPKHGPAVRLERADHIKTASYGTSREAREYRDRQRRLIIDGKFHEAAQMDVDDLRAKFGSKYDASIEQWQRYIDKLPFSKRTGMPRNPVGKKDQFNGLWY